MGSRFPRLVLLLRGDVDEAEEQTVSSLSLADRSGDLILRAFCLSILVRVALRRHDKDAVRSLAPEVEAADEAVRVTRGRRRQSMPRLAGVAGRPATRCSGVGHRSRGTFQAAPATRICKWLYIWPLVAVRLQGGKVAQAVTAARELLEPSQHRLPDELQSLVESAWLSWDRGDADVAGGSLALALEMAYELRFF